MRNGDFIGKGYHRLRHVNFASLKRLRNMHLIPNVNAETVLSVLSVLKQNLPKHHVNQ